MCRDRSIRGPTRFGELVVANGPWQFEIDRNDDGEARGLTSGKDVASKIMVPFCPESELSGVGLGNSEDTHHRGELVQSA